MISTDNFYQKFLSLCYLPVVAVTFVLLPVTLKAASLTPHRAIYSLGMGQARSGSAFVSIQGNMTLTVEKTCDGWIMTQNMLMNMNTAEGETLRQNMQFSGLESLDGKNYRFLANNIIGGKHQQIEGNARFASADNSGKINYKQPAKKTIVLPEATLFPISHTSWLIDRAMAGDRMAPRHVFDGADGGGPQEVVAFIGPRLNPGEKTYKAKKQLGALANRPGWNIRMAFYPINAKSSEPEYEIEVLQLDNGVAQRMLLDYHDFTINMLLEKIESIKPPSCQK